ncbi:MAG TPA: ankyrin repeat domain-containing protein [Steroidobacteraceae bacterium]
MPHLVLPQHPDPDQLKRQAKELLRAAKAADPAALARFRLLPAYRDLGEAQPARPPLALHDAQSVLAREYGFASWKALSEHIALLTLQSGDAVREFVEAATDGREDRADRLLRLHPGIAGANFHVALVTGDAVRAHEWLATNPALAHNPNGPRGWEPLLYVCHTSLRHGSATEPDGLIAIARRLLELGADPNMRFPWLHHGVQRPALWGAAHVVRLLPLVELLLQAGANANDGVTLPLAAGGGDTAMLDLLTAYGADPNQRWATDGAATLYAILHWAATSAGAHWLLQHGAEPDPVFADNGETPLHVVGKRWDVPLAEALVARGADPTRPRADGRTPYAIAELNANRTVADWLLSRGAGGKLRPVDRLVSACSRGDSKTAADMLAAHPHLRAEIGSEHYATLYRAAEQGDSAALEALLAIGLDPNRGDEEIGKTALHCAAMAGRADAVRILLDHGASPGARDREFHAPPLVWAAEGARSHAGDEDEYARVGRLLLDTGPLPEWHSDQGPADAIIEMIDKWRRTRVERPA